KALNIETIYQTLALADNIDAPGNLFLGRELTTRLGSLDDSSMESETRKIMGRLNPNFTRFALPVKSLSGGQRQAVAIARAVYFNADRKSTRLNSSHDQISYAVFCLKKKTYNAQPSPPHH